MLSATLMSTVDFQGFPQRYKLLHPPSATDAGQAPFDFGDDDTAMLRNYRVVKDDDKCHACGECVRRCQFFAHTFDKAVDEKPVYHRDKCVGCGACGMGCPSGALQLEPVPEAEWFLVPSSFQNWEERRMEFLAREGKAHE